MFDVAKDVTRYRLLRHAGVVAFLVPAALLAACAQEPAPAPQPAAVYQAPPPALAPPPAPARVIGERG